MGAILTILGLIFAYIIRSATEIQIIPNTTSSTTPSIINVVNTVNVSTTSHSILNMFNSTTTLNPQFIKQFQNFSNFLQVTVSDDGDDDEITPSIKMFNDSSFSGHVNKLISIDDITTNK
uniref:SJCHGC08858 protein n=1 Tax=Schistosoma japonicum TaxID=6182 RepID=Q5DA20_SCHJA|nr:SJCHGC08858 protein [Schistosoma japonicum]